MRKYKKKRCPRCGKIVSVCAFGFNSHLKKCLQSDVLFHKGYCLFDVPQPETQQKIQIGRKTYYAVQRK